MHQVGYKRSQVEGTHHPGLGGNLLAGILPVGNLELAAVGSLELAGEVDSHRKAGRMLVVVHSQQEEA